MKYLLDFKVFFLLIVSYTIKYSVKATGKNMIIFKSMPSPYNIFVSEKS
jgi:hypothetical protein